MKYKYEENTSKEKFNLLREGITHKSDNYTLKSLIEESKEVHEYDEPEVFQKDDEIIMKMIMIVLYVNFAKKQVFQVNCYIICKILYLMMKILQVLILNLININILLCI